MFIKQKSLKKPTKRCRTRTMAELKPCDCKRSKPVLITITDRNVVVESHVFCYGCGKSTPIFGSEEAAIDAWNKRS